MNYQEYWAEVKAIADEARDLIRKGEYPADEIGDWLHETIDGHQYVIYTAEARSVLEHSPNDCAIFDALGPQEWSDWSTAFSQAAYFALEQDVLEELGDIDLQSEEP